METGIQRKIYGRVEELKKNVTFIDVAVLTM